MKTLIIYDNEGYVISQMQGSSLREPSGIPFLWTDIPEGKYIESVDTTVTPNVPVLTDLPKSEIQKLQEENTEIKLALAELADIIGGANV